VWPFTVKKKGIRSVDENNLPSIGQLICRKHIQRLNENDAELRVWLPEVCKQAFDETVENNFTKGSTYLREFFIVYLYGEHELLQMQKNNTGIYYTPPLEIPSEFDGILFSIKAAVPEVLSGLGKNLVAIKLFLPKTIKDDLQLIANKVNIPLSAFVREVLISHLLGHTLWHERLKSWSPEEEQIGNSWEEGLVTTKHVFANTMLNSKPEAECDSIVHEY